MREIKVTQATMSIKCNQYKISSDVISLRYRHSKYTNVTNVRY